ncbi:MAG: hypothetical protein WC208_15035 [Gallionella sp.]|jgi:hypothetical protein
MDFGNMFSVDSSLAPSASAGTDWSRLISNPAVQMTGLNIAKAFDPNGFGGRLATSMAPMVQGKALAPTLTGQQPKPVNPLDKAKELSNASSLLKKAAEINPNVVPGFGDMMNKAVNMSPIGAAFAEKPELMPNPTVPIGDTFAEQAPVGATTSAQSFNYTMNPDTAAALGPDLVKDSFNYGLNVQKQINDNLLTPAQVANLNAEAAHKNWQIDPARVEEQIKINTAPVLAQFDVYAKKQALTKESIGSVLKANPGLAAIQLPGGGTVAQWAEMNAADPEGAKNISNIIAQGIHYNALKYSADLEYKGRLAAATAAGQDREFMKGVEILRKTETDIAALESLPSEEVYNKDPNRMFTYPKGPKTAGVLNVIKRMEAERDALGSKVYGDKYGEIVQMQKQAGLSSGTSITADPAKLKEIESAISTTPNPEVLQSMVEIFANPTSGAWRGL